MHIGIYTAGNVGQSLGSALRRAGHQLSYGVRDPESDKYAELRRAKVDFVPIAALAERCELLILAAPWAAAESILSQAGDLHGKVLVDATNPIGPGFKLTHGHSDSGGEQVQRWASNARVVKAFNTTGHENMADSEYPGGQLSMPLCGDDDEACDVVAGLIHDLGFEALRLGDLCEARILEPAAMLWIRLAIVRGEGRGIGFSLLRRSNK